MAQHGTTWIEQANNNKVILIIIIQSNIYYGIYVFKTDATKIPLPPPLFPAIGAEALSSLPTFLVVFFVMEGMGVVIVIVIITTSPPQWRSGGGDAAAVLCRAVMQS